VLVELEFLSNPDGERRLANPAYRQKLAQGIAQGVVEYLKGLGLAKGSDR
jgi:N-acetylmuramoyl-L-alanine amidase